MCFFPYQRIMFCLLEYSHVLFPKDRMRLSQSIIYIPLPREQCFFPEDPDRMRFSQWINVHFPEDRLCRFPKTYFIIFKEKSKKTNIIPLTDHNCQTQLLKRITQKKFMDIVSQNIGNRDIGREGGECYQAKFK